MGSAITTHRRFQQAEFNHPLSALRREIIIPQSTGTLASDCYPKNIKSIEYGENEVFPAMKILGLSGNVKRPSRTAALVTAIVDAAEVRGQARGAVSRVIELVDAAPVLFRALRADQLDAEGQAIIDAVEAADVLVVGSPVYRASYTGALKHLFDLVDYRALAGKPVILAATGGTPLHGLMTEHQLRPLFGFFNALTLPTAIYATEADFTDHTITNPALRTRIERAVSELERVLPPDATHAHADTVHTDAGRTSRPLLSAASA
ncbi:MsuE subfamily FMN reductase [Rhizobium sp. PP-WC-2G-219]|nr:MsuE subfamily FMN reductase [Rhizobium sp. PP-WC-2G-219]